jgi:lipopolysaccharide/colanic/teichoic acid biosynthesis glycosyltransferase
MLPVLLFVGVAICLWIRLVSPGHILFKQVRVGLNGQKFHLYKFRSMKPGVSMSLHDNYVTDRMRSGKSMPKLDLVGDPRIIRGGRLLRLSGFDELPQLINVLRGEMTLVGPRPCTEKEYAAYQGGQRHRFSVHPGLTGLWQVRRNRSTTFPQMIELDEAYISNRSLGLDLRIILRTPVSLIAQMRETSGPNRQAFESRITWSSGVGRKS